MAASASTPNLLFIDDDDDLVHALSVVLTRAGYKVRHAPDGEEGVRMAGEDTPDIVLLDFMMPGMNGFEACCELRRLDGMSDVPIIALTAFGRDIGETHGLSHESAEAVVQDFLEKPVEPNILLARLAAALPS